MKRVAQLWNWLPTFRAAGETELLSQAGQDLGLSTSAVSRTVRLLEEDLGVPLFERQGRSVRLNDAGQRLLDATRNAMRIVDEAIVETNSMQSRGLLRIACDEPLLTQFLLPVLPPLRRAHPALLPHVTPSEGRDLSTLLRKGDIDVALSSREHVGPGLQSHLLGVVSSSYYVGPGHPLYRGRAPTAKALDEYPRAVLRRDAPQSAATVDPAVTLVVEQLGALLAAAHGGAYVALLPDALARRQPSLRRLRPDTRAPANAFVVQRERLSVRTQADVLVAALVEHA
jgi:DNA-binding transcriptional LysR family regulator